MAISNSARGHFQKQHEAEPHLKDVLSKIEVVYPGILDAPDCYVRHRSRVEAHVPHLAFIGGEFFRKGGPVAVEAFAQLRKDLDIKMTVVSSLSTGNPILPLDSGATERWRSRLQEIGVRHVEYLPPDAVRELLADVDILVHPTLNDSFGYAVTEAMATG